MNWIKKNKDLILLVFSLAFMCGAWIFWALTDQTDLGTGLLAGATWVYAGVYIVVLLSFTARKRAEGDELARARPVDPDNPPGYQTMIRLPGDPATPCTCHSRPLGDGETVLRWPHPDSLLCEETHKNGEL